jgi:hypothetical protein
VKACSSTSFIHFSFYLSLLFLHLVFLFFFLKAQRGEERSCDQQQYLWFDRAVFAKVDPKSRNPKSGQVSHSVDTEKEEFSLENSCREERKTSNETTNDQKSKTKMTTITPALPADSPSIIPPPERVDHSLGNESENIYSNRTLATTYSSVRTIYTDEYFSHIIEYYRKINGKWKHKRDPDSHFLFHPSQDPPSLRLNTLRTTSVHILPHLLCCPPFFLLLLLLFFFFFFFLLLHLSRSSSKALC